MLLAVVWYVYLYVLYFFFDNYFVYLGYTEI